MKIKKQYSLFRALPLMKKLVLVVAAVCCAASVRGQEVDYSDYYYNYAEKQSDDGVLKFCQATELPFGMFRKEFGEYKTRNGETKKFDFGDEQALLSQITTVKRDDGTVYYLLLRYFDAMPDDKYIWLDAYEILNGELTEVSFLDGKICSKDEMPLDHVNFNWTKCYYKTNGFGWEWIFQYDDKDKTLYVPLSFDLEDGFWYKTLSDRYKVYRFDGKKFVHIGERPHKGLHKSVEDYLTLAYLFKTKNYIVRVDVMDYMGTLRYASWKNSDMSQPPDLVIYGGRKDEEEDIYNFTNHNFEYIVGEDDCLIVKKDGKVLLREKRIWN